MFAYCGNDPVQFKDPTGKFGLFAAIIAAGAIVGAVLGAFTAATTGGNIIEGAIEGGITGAVAATCGLLISNPVVAIATATAGGFITDVATQATTQYIDNGQVDFKKIDYKRSAKIAIETGVGAAIPQMSGTGSASVDAFATALVWAEGSALIACGDTIYENIVASISQDSTAATNASSSVALSTSTSPSPSESYYSSTPPAGATTITPISRKPTSRFVTCSMM